MDQSHQQKSLEQTKLSINNTLILPQSSLNVYQQKAVPFQKSQSQILRKSKRTLSYAHLPMQKQVPDWNKSSSTLRHSSYSFAFSKNPRFETPKCNYQDAQQHNIPSTLHKRSCSFGIGQKVQIPKVFLSNRNKQTAQCPFYEVDGDNLRRNKSNLTLRQGKTFGIGWKNYEASRTPHRPTVHSSHQVRAIPGPNHYKLNPEEKNINNKIMMHPRLQMYSNLNGIYRLSEPDPQTYVTKENLVKKNTLKTSFGYGQKVDFTKSQEKTPGPQYNMLGFCDKFIHLQKQIQFRKQ